MRRQQALVLTKSLGYGPVSSRCHLGLGRIDEARAELATAVAMLRKMGMASWLTEAEREFADLGT